MRKLTMMDIKGAIWDKRFQSLFPEHAEQIEKFLKDPGCACNVSLYRKLMGYKDRLKTYFPNKEIVTPAEEDAAITDGWVVLNCSIDKLDVKMKQYPKDKIVVAACRWKDQLTVVLNDAQAASYVDPKSEGGKKVINTTKDDLAGELKKLAKGRKSLALARWEDEITVVVNDLSPFF